ncbi:MAG: zinc-binding dehydrogenase [Acidimicrobiales bacterium]
MTGTDIAPKVASALREWTELGVARTTHLVYFALDDPLVGSMAQETVIHTRRSITLPEGTDPARIAAGMNPGMSSWIALTLRVEWEIGRRVLVLGATGNAGRMAVQISKHLGARSVTAAGRDPERLELLRSLGADVIVQLAGDSEAVSQRLGEAAGEVDVVLDYVWGRPALDAIVGIIKARSD